MTQLQFFEEQEEDAERRPELRVESPAEQDPRSPRRRSQSPRQESTSRGLQRQSRSSSDVSTRSPSYRSQTPTGSSNAATAPGVLDAFGPVGSADMGGPVDSADMVWPVGSERKGGTADSIDPPEADWPGGADTIGARRPNAPIAASSVDGRSSRSRARANASLRWADSRRAAYGVVPGHVPESRTVNAGGTLVDATRPGDAPDELDVELRRGTGTRTRPGRTKASARSAVRPGERDGGSGTAADRSSTEARQRVDRATGIAGPVGNDGRDGHDVSTSETVLDHVPARSTGESFARSVRRRRTAGSAATTSTALVSGSNSRSVRPSPPVSGSQTGAEPSASNHVPLAGDVQNRRRDVARRAGLRSAGSRERSRPDPANAHATEPVVDAHPDPSRPDREGPATVSIDGSKSVDPSVSAGERSLLPGGRSGTTFARSIRRRHATSPIGSTAPNSLREPSAAALGRATAPLFDTAISESAGHRSEYGQRTLSSARAITPVRSSRPTTAGPAAPGVGHPRSRGSVEAETTIHSDSTGDTGDRRMELPVGTGPNAHSSERTRVRFSATVQRRYSPSAEYGNEANRTGNEGRKSERGTAGTTMQSASSESPARRDRAASDSRRLHSARSRRNLRSRRVEGGRSPSPKPTGRLETANGRLAAETARPERESVSRAQARTRARGAGIEPAAVSFRGVGARSFEDVEETSPGTPGQFVRSVQRRHAVSTVSPVTSPGLAPQRERVPAEQRSSSRDGGSHGGVDGDAARVSRQNPNVAPRTGSDPGSSGDHRERTVSSDSPSREDSVWSPLNGADRGSASEAGRGAGVIGAGNPPRLKENLSGADTGSVTDRSAVAPWNGNQRSGGNDRLGASTKRRAWESLTGAVRYHDDVDRSAVGSSRTGASGSATGRRPGRTRSVNGQSNRPFTHAKLPLVRESGRSSERVVDADDPPLAAPNPSDESVRSGTSGSEPTPSDLPRSTPDTEESPAYPGATNEPRQARESARPVQPRRRDGVDQVDLEAVLHSRSLVDDLVEKIYRKIERKRQIDRERRGL